MSNLNYTKICLYEKKTTETKKKKVELVNLSFHFPLFTD